MSEKKVQSHALAMIYRLNNQKMFLPSSNPENSKVAPEKINPSEQIYLGVSWKMVWMKFGTLLTDQEVQCLWLVDLGGGRNGKGL